MKSWMLAARAAASSSCCEASGRPSRMFSSTVPWNRNVSWFTTEISDADLLEAERAQVVAAQA